MLYDDVPTSVIHDLRPKNARTALNRTVKGAARALALLYSRFVRGVASMSLPPRVHRSGGAAARRGRAGGAGGGAAEGGKVWAHTI